MYPNTVAGAVDLNAVAVAVAALDVLVIFSVVVVCIVHVSAAVVVVELKQPWDVFQQKSKTINSNVSITRINEILRRTI